MKKNLYLTISASVFGVVAALHVARVILDVPIMIGDDELPMGVSWVGFAGTTVLSFWGFRLAKDGDR